jgi:parvulin-like peptidyl-prolyl isomerase
MKSIVRVFTAVLIGGLLFAGAGCAKKDIIATVNGEAITGASIEAQLKQLESQYPQMFQGVDGPTRKDEFKKRLIDNAVNQLLIKQEAAKQGLTVPDEEIAKTIADLKKNFPNDAAFEEALKKNGITLAELTERERENLLAQRLIEKMTKNAAVDEKAMKDYYEKNKATVFTDKAAAHAQHILFAEKDKANAEKVLAEINAGGDFAALAKKWSTDPGSKEKGGDLGWPTTPYVPEFQKAIDSLKVGQISGLVKTQYGWHIIKVLEIRGQAVKPFEKVKDQIKQILLQQQQADTFQKLLDQLKKAAKIEYTEGNNPNTPAPAPAGSSGATSPPKP